MTYTDEQIEAIRWGGIESDAIAREHAPEDWIIRTALVLARNRPVTEPPRQTSDFVVQELDSLVGFASTVSAASAAFYNELPWRDRMEKCMEYAGWCLEHKHDPPLPIRLDLVVADYLHAITDGNGTVRVLSVPDLDHPDRPLGAERPRLAVFDHG